MTSPPKRQEGTCKWFNAVKGYGFVTPLGGGDDLFVHQMNIKSEGFRSLKDGEPLEYDLEEGEDGRHKAVNISGPDGASLMGAQPRPAITSGMLQMNLGGGGGMSNGRGMPMSMGGGGAGGGGGGGGRYGPGPSRPQGGPSSNGFYSYGSPPMLPPDAQPFYVGYYLPRSHQGQGDGGRGQGRGGDSHGMSGPVFYSQGPPPPGMMGSHPGMNGMNSNSAHMMQMHYTQHHGGGQRTPQQQSSGYQLVVHNLPWTCTWQQLLEHFQGYGAERAEVVLDPNGRSRGFGTVKFYSPEDAQAACEALNNSSIDGRTISVRSDRFG